MGFIIGLLTVIMVLDCVALVLLVLIQLPKKEAGAGLAFGGGATDALFGAGSGNVLTKVTKYVATVFFALALVLAFMQTRYHSRNQTEFQRRLEQPAAQQQGGLLPAAPAPATPAPTAPATPAQSNPPAAPAPASTPQP